MKVQILLLSERDFLTLPVLRSMDRNKFEFFVMGPKESTVRFSRFCKRYFQYPKWTQENKDERLVSTINLISAKHKIDIVIPLDLDSTLWMAKNKQKIATLVSPISDCEKLLRLHSKWELTILLEKISIKYPKTILVKNESDLVDGIFPYPFLIKPVDQDSGSGIVKINNEFDLKQYHRALSKYKAFPLIVQQYIDGSDIDMSLLAINGKIVAWTIQRWSQQGMLEFVSNQEIHNIGEKIIAEEKYSGFMHIDLRVDNQTREIFVLECNPRVWGTINASILAGVNFIEACIDCAMHRQKASQGKVFEKKYATFGKTFVMLMMRPWLLSKISKISRRDFVAVISDPIPYFLLAWKVWRGDKNTN